jgi:hypothetical protein
MVLVSVPKCRTGPRPPRAADPCGWRRGCPCPRKADRSLAAHSAGGSSSRSPMPTWWATAASSAWMPSTRTSGCGPCVGINVGDAFPEGSDVHGDVANVAARLQAECPRSGICVSRAVREHVRRRLDLAFRALGPLNLKNIAALVEAFVLPPEAHMPSSVEHALVHGGGEALRLPDKPIAVPAFANIRGDVEQEYFSDGIADDIITELAAQALAARHRAQIQLHLQRPRSGREAGRARTGCRSGAGGQCTPRWRSHPRRRPADRRQDRHCLLGVMLVYSGQPSRGRDELLTWLRLSPSEHDNAVPLTEIAVSHYFDRAYGSALETARRTALRFLGFPTIYRWVAASLGQLERGAEAREACNRR